MNPSLISILFPLTATANTTLPIHSGRIMQGAFLKWLQRDYPELSVKLHDRYQRLYTVSALQGDLGAGERGWLKIQAGQNAFFRVTAIHEEIASALLQAAEAGEGGPELDDGNWQPQAPMIDGHDLTKESSFVQLAEQAQEMAERNHLAPEVVLRFTSPTCFIENEQSLPLPVPRYVFGNLFNQWQSASPFPLPVEDVDHFITSIHLAYTSLKTQFIDFGKFRRVGFVGLVRFGLHPKFPPMYRMLLHLLAEFASFSGVGSHTTMGMGQVIRVKNGRK